MEKRLCHQAKKVKLYSGLDLDSADGALGGGGCGVGGPFRVLKKADVELKVGGKPKQYSVVIKVLPTDDPGESDI